MTHPIPGADGLTEPFMPPTERAAAWVTPLRYGSKLTFPKPPKPEGWDDDEEKWFCNPLFSAEQVRDAIRAALAAAPSQPAPIQATSEAWEFIAILSLQSGGMLNGNRISMRAKELLKSTPMDGSIRPTKGNDE